MSESKSTVDPTNTSDGLLENLRRKLRRRNGPAEPFTKERKPVFSSLLAEGEIAGGGKGAALDAAAQFETRFVSTIWRLGRQDAGIGQTPDEAEAVLESKADLDWTDRRSKAQEAIHDKEARLLLVKAHQERLEKSCEALKLERWHLAGHPLVPPSSGLSPMALLYVVVGIGAFAAEFPLSVNLIDQGLSMPIAQLNNSNNLAMWALAVVLCIFGLAVKIWFDSAAEVWPAKQSPTSASSNGPAQRGTVFRRGAWAKVLFFLVNCCLLVCSVKATLTIAELRKDLAEESQIITKLKGDGVDEGLLAQNQTLKNAIAQRQESAGNTMVWLTITLPLFGAISFITGATKLKQSNEDRAAYRSLKTAEKELTDYSAEAATLKHEIESALERLKEEQGDGTTKAGLLKTQLDVYRHGYARGHLLPEERVDGTFYDFHVNALRRKAQRNVRTCSLEALKHD